jgi:hypothetical protein
MAPYARTAFINRDVNHVLSADVPAYNDDPTTKFGPDLGMTQGAFAAFLDDLTTALNTDTDLALLSPFDWRTLPGDPASGNTFAEYYLDKAVVDLIGALDGILSHSPYET